MFKLDFQIFICNIELLPNAMEMASTSIPSKHIVSFVNQKKSKSLLDEFQDFDLNDLRGDEDDEIPEGIMTQRENAIRLVLKRLIERRQNLLGDDVYLNTESNLMTRQIHENTKNSTMNDTINTSTQSSKAPENSSDDTFKPPERPSFANGLWHRAKIHLNVTEPVQHILNTLRERIYGIKPTPAHKKRPMHLLHPQKSVGQVHGGNANTEKHHESVAIETENERIMINESTGFHVLELIGTVVGLVWGFFTNIQAIFGASSAGGSFGSSSGNAVPNMDNDTFADS